VIYEVAEIIEEVVSDEPVKRNVEDRKSLHNQNHQKNQKRENQNHLNLVLKKKESTL
jgi:hypothetical protein